MLELSNHTNLLEEETYKYSLQDVAEPMLYRDIYSYDTVPKIAFNHRRVPIGMPEEIWITDTTFRDGQQSIEPYTVEQIVELYKLMSRLGGPYGIIRHWRNARSWGCNSRRSPPGSGRTGRISSW